MVTGRGNNKTGWSNLEYDNLIKKAASATSTNLRNSYFDKAEHILMDELPLIPIFEIIGGVIVYKGSRNLHILLMYWVNSIHLLPSFEEWDVIDSAVLLGLF